RGRGNERRPRGEPGGNKQRHKKGQAASSNDRAERDPRSGGAQTGDTSGDAGGDGAPSAPKPGGTGGGEGAHRAAGRPRR
ncbi:hypothetical protein C3R44_23190, partial [Mycobacterium tuberculosis]